ALGRGLFETGGINHAEREIAELRPALAPIARDSGKVVHQCEASSDEAIEQGRLADVGSSDNGDGEAHDRRCLLRMPLCRAAAKKAISAAPAGRATRPRRPRAA